MGSGSHQTERCETDEEAARWIATRKAKRNAEGVRLGLREDVELVEYRGAQLVEARVGQLHFRLHASDPGHPEPAGPASCVAHQSGLADSLVTADDERRTSTLARVIE